MRGAWCVVRYYVTFERRRVAEIALQVCRPEKTALDAEKLGDSAFGYKLILKS
jgi:hypothetical protein